MLPSLTVPNLLPLNPTNELRDAHVPVPTSKLVAVSICQMAFRPKLPRFRSPRKPMEELDTSTSWRESGVVPGQLLDGQAVLVALVPTRVEKAEAGAVAPVLFHKPNCGYSLP